MLTSGCQVKYLLDNGFIQSTYRWTAKPHTGYVSLFQRFQRMGVLLWHHPLGFIQVAFLLIYDNTINKWAVGEFYLLPVLRIGNKSWI